MIASARPCPLVPPQNLHGKEGVVGSSPSESFARFLCPRHFRSSVVGDRWQPQLLETIWKPASAPDSAGHRFSRGDEVRVMSIRPLRAANDRAAAEGGSVYQSYETSTRGGIRQRCRRPSWSRPAPTTRPGGASVASGGGLVRGMPRGGVPTSIAPDKPRRAGLLLPSSTARGSRSARRTRAVKRRSSATGSRVRESVSCRRSQWLRGSPQVDRRSGLERASRRRR